MWVTSLRSGEFQFPHTNHKRCVTVPSAVHLLFKVSRTRSARGGWKFGWLTLIHTWQYFKQNRVQKKEGGIYRFLVSHGTLVSAEVNSVLTSWPFVLQPSFTKASDVAHLIAADRPLPSCPPSSGPVLHPLSKCHLANKTPVHTEPEQKAASSIHTVAVNPPPLPDKRCHLLQNPAVCSLLYY